LPWQLCAETALETAAPENAGTNVRTGKHRTGICRSRIGAGKCMTENADSGIYALNLNLR